MRLIVLVVALFTGVLGQAQNLDPVKWEVDLVKVQDGNYELRFTADIEKNWAIYSQHIGDNGPIPTTFTIEENTLYTTEGEVSEPSNPIVEHDEMFDMTLTKYKGPSIFIQKLKSKEDLQSVKGTIEFMTCDSKRCLPPKIIDFTANLKA